MPRAAPIQTNFTAGELSPRLEGRVDLAKYFNGCSKLENMTVFPHGGATRRGGTKHIAATKNASETVKLIPFEFSTIQAYILEFGRQYMRVFKDQGQVITGGAEKVTNGTFDADVSSWTGIGSGSMTWDGANQRMSLSGGMELAVGAKQIITGLTIGTIYQLSFDMTIPGSSMAVSVGTTDGGNDLLFSFISSTGAHTFNFTATGVTTVYLQFGANKTPWGPVYVDNVSVVEATTTYEISTPYLESELKELQYAQSADTMYIAHGSAQRKLARTGHAAWTLSEITFIDGPYLPENITGTTLTPSATTGSGITITASASLFVATDVGRLVSIKVSSGWGYAKITGFTSDLIVTADVVNDFDGTTAVTTWKLGAWSDTTGYPTCVAFYEQRLWWGGTKNQPQTLWASKSGDYENHTAGVNDDDALIYTIATDKVNAIQWLSPGKVMAVGTAGGEFIISASSLEEAVTPTNVRIVRQSTYGSDYILPSRISNVVLFIQRAGKKLRQFTYEFESDGYIAPDLTLLAEHVSEGGLLETAYQQEPDSVLWVVRGDGVMLGLTYQPDQEVVAWHRHILGGISDVGGTQAKVESIAVIPSSITGRDELWLAVKRYINGSTVRHVELLTEGLTSSGSLDDAFFVDDGLTYSGPEATAISGLDHLEGETVNILADGAVHPDKTVSGGSITLDYAASKVHIGLHKESVLQTMRLEGGSADGTSQGKTKRISEIRVRLYRTLGVLLGSDENSLDRVPFRSSDDPMDSPPPLYTGDKKLKNPQGFETDAKITVKQDQPLPFTVLSIMPILKTNN